MCWYAVALQLEEQRVRVLVAAERAALDEESVAPTVQQLVDQLRTAHLRRSRENYSVCVQCCFYCFRCSYCIPIKDDTVAEN